MKTFTSFPSQDVSEKMMNGGAPFISVQFMGRTLFLSPDAITFMEGEGNYTFIYTTGGKKYLVSKTLKSLTVNLSQNFIRVHKSYLINKNYVVERIEDDRMLRMSCGKEVCVSRRKIKEITDILDHSDLRISA
jgi:two-component system LytT family response regulator